MHCVCMFVCACVYVYAVRERVERLEQVMAERSSMTELPTATQELATPTSTTSGLASDHQTHVFSGTPFKKNKKNCEWNHTEPPPI